MCFVLLMAAFVDYLSLADHWDRAGCRWRARWVTKTTYYRHYDDDNDYYCCYDDGYYYTVTTTTTTATTIATSTTATTTANHFQDDDSAGHHTVFGAMVYGCLPITYYCCLLAFVSTPVSIIAG